MQGNTQIILWISLAMLVVALAVWGQQRRAATRARAARARRAAERGQLGGDSFFLPPAPIEQAVELSNPVEIEALVAGEPADVADVVRRQLDQTTDIALTGGLGDLSLSLGNTRPPPPTLRDRIAPSRAEPAPPPSAPPSTDEITRVPVRELVLAWFEARGYRAELAGAAARPVELVLRHRKTPERTYAFAVEGGTLTGQRIAGLLSQARAVGVTRLLIAVEGSVEGRLAQQVRPAGIRILDEAGIRAELARIDLGVAAKIIAVARGRAARRHGSADVAQAERTGLGMTTRVPFTQSKF